MPDHEPHFQCRHIFHDGHRCGSKCLRREDFCYYHHTTRRPAPRKTVSSFAESGGPAFASQMSAKRSAFDLPDLEDAVHPDLDDPDFEDAELTGLEEPDGPDLDDPGFEDADPSPADTVTFD